MTRPILALFAFALTLAPSAAFAHPVLDRAREELNQANFARALSILEELDDAEDIPRDTLRDALVMRAEAQKGLGSVERARAELRRLVALAPEFEPGIEWPPVMRTWLEEARGNTEPIAVHARLEAVTGGAMLTVDVTGDEREGLVRTVLLHARMGDGDWRHAEGQRLDLVAPIGTSVAYYAEVRSLGNALIATHGTSEEPIVEQLAPPLDRATADAHDGDDHRTVGAAHSSAGGSSAGGEDPDPTALALGIGGAGLGVVLGVLAVLLFAEPGWAIANDDAPVQLAPPIIGW